MNLFTRTKARLLALVTFVSLGLGAPTLSQVCQVTNQHQDFNAIVNTQIACASGVTCPSECVVAIDATAWQPAGGCFGTSGFFIECSDSSNFVQFNICARQHYLFPANGANWGAIAGGLPCSSFLGYVTIP